MIEPRPKGSFRKMRKKINRERKDIFRSWLRATGVRIRNKLLFQFEECSVIYARYERVIDMQKVADEIGYPICKDQGIINRYIFDGMRSLSQTFDYPDGPFMVEAYHRNPTLYPEAYKTTYYVKKPNPCSIEWVQNLLFPVKVLEHQISQRNVNDDFDEEENDQNFIG